MREEREGVESSHLLFERQMDGVFLLDQDGRFVAMNAEAERISGYTAQEVKEITFSDLCPPNCEPESDRAFRKALQGEARDFETTMVRKDGRRVDLRLVGCPIMIDGSRNGLLFMARDVNQPLWGQEVLRKEREELAAQVEEGSAKLRDEIAKRAIAENHIRSLASELSMAEYRERERLAHVLHDSMQQTLVGVKYQLAAMEKGISELKGAASEIRGLIDDAIETSRSLAAELSPPILRQGLAPALEWLAGWMRRKLGMTVNLSIPDILAPQELTVFLFQAVRELLLNAAKHAGAGAARVSIAVDRQELRVAVEDDGAGFDSNQINVLDAEGGGFGLVTISERVNLLGGRLEVASAPGVGSRFTLVVPLPMSQ